jgi:hypothetical protein
MYCLPGSSSDPSIGLLLLPDALPDDYLSEPSGSALSCALPFAGFDRCVAEPGPQLIQGREVVLNGPKGKGPLAALG